MARILAPKCPIGKQLPHSGAGLYMVKRIRSGCNRPNGQAEIALGRLHSPLCGGLLTLIERVVKALLAEQFVVGALFGDYALFHHQDEVSAAQGGKAVGD
jgi:hypothetical protein